MRQRITKEGLFGQKYVLAASTKNVSGEKSSLWVNSNKTSARRKKLSDLWSN